MAITRPPSGSLLIAEPFMPDQNFQRAVVLLCESHDEGAFGLILNKPSEMKVHELVENFPPVDCTVFYGGPVQLNTLHYLHRCGDLLPNSIKIADDLYWGGDFDQLIALMDTHQLAPQDIRFFFGYSGWDGQQILDELEANSWFVGKVKAAHVFDEDPRTLWRVILRDMGDQYRLIANLPEHPSLN